MMHISLPEDVCAHIDLMYFDPARGKPIYGIYAMICTGLRRKWIADPTILPIVVDEIQE